MTKNKNKIKDKKINRYNSPYLMNIKEIVESNSRFFDKKYLLNNNNKLFSTLSGSELPYNPQKWNDNINIKNNHNCYAYVLNQIASRRKGKPQPGYFSNFPFTIFTSTIRPSLSVIDMLPS